MPEHDSVETQRHAVPTVGAELEAAGFSDAQEIGRGGFGVVYRCRQQVLDRTVAVKVLLADLDDENRERFFREQQAMGRLTGHPNIVSALQVGSTDSGHPFIVMQYHPQGSLDEWIRRNGPLPLEQSLRLGVKLAGSLETAHRLGILHRDIKPANILFTEYGEPALADFGIAHIAGGFKTGTGVVTGSPAFTAPEVLTGETPSAASDVYGLGATLFCAITGHAAFERRSGEQLVAQFVRISTEPVPDLREQGIADDVCGVVDRAMSRTPADRQPTAADLGDELREVEIRHGFPADDMALHDRRRTDGPDTAKGPPLSRRSRPPTWTSSAVDSGGGKLPLELTSFVGRRNELSAVRNLLAASRLVTLTGIGGVGKTRLGLQVAEKTQRNFAAGAWLIELGELSDQSLLLDAVAASLGLRDQSARPTDEVVVDFLAPRELLLVLDNCEHMVDAAAKLAETLLRACPRLRILATSRETLGIGAEAVLRVPPLAVPDPDREPSLQGLPSYDAVTLFAERAGAAVPAFEITDANRTTVARICQRLDGLPLPIELAAARLRAMSPEQVLQRLTDRYALLTRGSRVAPSRQQTLRLCIDWSHDLCTAQEQLVWSRLSVFAGSLELDAVEQVCGDGFALEELLDTLTSLVDKSILIREESQGVVRFRLLETLRDYGREQAQLSGEYAALRRRHRDWYQKLALDSDKEWISSRQLEWLARLAREQPNLREAMEFSVSDDPESGLRIAAALFSFWNSRGQFSEGRRWLDRFLACKTGHNTVERAKALYADSVLAEIQGDLVTATALIEEGRELAEQSADSITHALIAYAEGLLALFNGNPRLACTRAETALEFFDVRNEPALHVSALDVLGMAYEQLGEPEKAIDCYERVLAITEPRGESIYRSYALWSMAVAVWRQGDRTRASFLLEQALLLAWNAANPHTAAMCLEALAWIARDDGDAYRAAVLMGAAEELVRSVGGLTALFPNTLVYHQDCIDSCRAALGKSAFAAAQREGTALRFDTALVYATRKENSTSRPRVFNAPSIPTPTKRERQVAALVAEGLTNKEIAARLVISPRTAQGHVEHLLAKLGFTSRAQIAAWVVEQEQPGRSRP